MKYAEILRGGDSRVWLRNLVFPSVELALPSPKNPYVSTSGNHQYVIIAHKAKSLNKTTKTYKAIRYMRSSMRPRRQLTQAGKP